jgi:hypothetical protein
MTLPAYAAEELKRDPSLALALEPTPAAIVQARDERGLRWERVAVYAGIKVGEARRLYTEGSGKPWQTSHTGRGRNFAAEYAAANKPKRRARRSPVRGPPRLRAPAPRPSGVPRRGRPVVSWRDAPMAVAPGRTHRREGDVVHGRLPGTLTRRSQEQAHSGRT